MSARQAVEITDGLREGRVAMVAFTDYARSVAQALDAIDAKGVLAGQRLIVLKPNLVNAEPHPVTTPPACVEAIWAYCHAHSRARIVIAEGSGGIDTPKAYAKLGYTELAKRIDVELIDLDAQECVALANPALRFLRTFHLPRVLVDAFIVSIPVLKAHSMSTVTLAMKNMFGVAPAKHYKGPGFRKAQLHGQHADDVDRYVFELMHYCRPGLSVIDATVGMAQAHLWGPRCDPPVNKILASPDPVAIDAAGAALLGVDWRHVEHIRLAHGVFGRA